MAEMPKLLHGSHKELIENKIHTLINVLSSATKRKLQIFNEKSFKNFQWEITQLVVDDDDSTFVEDLNQFIKLLIIVLIFHKKLYVHMTLFSYI